jgi:sec-independent protein translocase protein TatC
MPLLEHLRELRSRLIRAVIAMVLGSIVCFIFYENIVEALIEPVCESGAKGVSAGDCGALVVTGVVGPLSLQLKVALYGGLIATAPLWLYQLWAFLAPGLHRREKKWAYLFVGFGAPLFALGATLAYIMLPVAVRILLGFAPGDLANQVPLNEYIDFVLRFMIVFGLAFELPLILVIMNIAGVVTSKQIRSWWRQMIFGIAVFAAIATPTPDPYSMMALMTPMALLYGIAIIVTAVLDKRKSRRERALTGDHEDLP